MHVPGIRLYALRKTAATALLCLFLIAVCCAPLQAAAGQPGAEQQAVSMIEDALETLAAWDMRDQALQQTLPPELARVLEAAVAAARHCGDTQEKIRLLVDGLGVDCSQFLYYTLVAVVIDVFDILPFDRLIVQILAAVTLLCYLGVV